jgi:hypothetical protein
MAKCNTTPGCNYIYMQTNNSGNNDAQSVNNCYMGNKSAPAYALNTYNKGPYQLYVKNKVLDSSDVSLNGVGNITSDNFNPVAFGTSTLSGYNFLGENLTSPTEIGPKNTPPGLAIYNQSEYIRLGPSGTLSQPATKTELSPAAKEEQQSTITTRLKTDNVASTTTNTDVFKNELTSFISTSGFRNREGFDTHGYNNPGEQCGVGTNTPCQAGVLFGQLKPLQQIAQDYSSRLGAIERQYQDLSNNIDAYNRRYATLTETDANGKLRNPQYDFSGNQPIVIQDNSKLESKMQNDTKLLALQTNNMYIAGTILTSTLLISAIYLGRS